MRTSPAGGWDCSFSGGEEFHPACPGTFQTKGETLTMCARCNGCLVIERVETVEGRLVMSRCIICGFREDLLMREHKRCRPEPFRQVPQPARGRNRS